MHVYLSSFGLFVVFGLAESPGQEAKRVDKGFFVKIVAVPSKEARGTQIALYRTGLNDSRRDDGNEIDDETLKELLRRPIRINGDIENGLIIAVEDEKKVTMKTLFDAINRIRQCRDKGLKTTVYVVGSGFRGEK
jgi:hypothetical protein